MKHRKFGMMQAILSQCDTLVIKSIADQKYIEYPSVSWASPTIIDFRFQNLQSGSNSIHQKRENLARAKEDREIVSPFTSVIDWLHILITPYYT